MIRPKTLSKGDQVAIVATARKVKLEALQPAIDLLKSWGLVPVIGDSIGLENHQFAGSDKARAEDFQKQMDNPEIKAIWCAKGGYGTVRMLDLLDFSRFKNNPKWIIGYSDITVLHAKVNQMDIASLHAQMAIQIDTKSDQSRESLRDVLFGKPLQYEFETHSKYNRNGKVSGEIVGGNLSVIYSLCGSSTALETQDKILFLEDLDEYLYHIDRMMQNLKRNAYFKKVKAIIVGGFSSMRDNSVPFGQTAEEIISETLSGYDFPLVFDFPAGHIKDNRALIFGQTATLTIENQKASLIY